MSASNPRSSDEARIPATLKLYGAEAYRVPAGGRAETGLLWLNIAGKLHRLRFWAAEEWDRLAGHERPLAVMVGEHGGRWEILPWSVSGPTSPRSSARRPGPRPV